MANNPHAAWNVTTRDWNMPANVVLDNLMQLYRAGELDRAVANRPDLKRFTDALVTTGNMTLEAGRLVPKIDPNTGWWYRLDAKAPNTQYPGPLTPDPEQITDSYAKP